MKQIALIPHYVALFVLGVIVAVLQIGLWVPVLLTGTYPAWAYSFVGGTMRWGVRVQAFSFGLTDRYPPFGPNSDGTDDYPVRVTFAPQSSYQRLWAVPALGLIVKCILAIPHLVIIWALSIVAAVLMMITWIPVLFVGRYPDWGQQLVGGYLRWNTRTAAYLYGLTDRYPPFELG